MRGAARSFRTLLSPVTTLDDDSKGLNFIDLLCHVR